MLRFFERKVFGRCKSQIFLFETKMRGVETEWRRLRNVARGTEAVLRGLGGHSANLEAWR